MEFLKKNSFYIFTSFMLLTISNSGFVVSQGYDDYIAYFGYFLFFARMFINFLHMNIEEKRDMFSIRNILILALLTIGIFVQDLALAQKVRLIITMLVIFVYSMYSYIIAQDIEEIKTASYGIMYGLWIALIIGVVTKFPLISELSEGISNASFNGGINHKNTYGFLLLSIYTGLIIYMKNRKLNKRDIGTLILVSILIVVSGSRGALLLAFIFTCIMVSDYLFVLVRISRQKFLKIMFLTFSVSIVIFVLIIAPRSGTFSFRINGLVSWVRVFGNNLHVMLFGYASEAFKNSNYNENVRNLISWKGTTEMGVLSILVKNGILGLIGYVIIFVNYLRKILRLDNIKVMVSSLALVFTMIVSTITEPYLINIAVCYGTFSFMVLNCLLNDKNKQIKKGM